MRGERGACRRQRGGVLQDSWAEVSGTVPTGQEESGERRLVEGAWLLRVEEPMAQSQTGADDLTELSGWQQ